MTSPQQTSTPANEYPYTFDINQWTAQVHAPRPRHASAAPSPAVPPPLSSHFQAAFARQMEANPPNLCTDPNEIPIPIRPFQIPPVHLSPTIEEIESLTLDSGPLQDMGDYLVDDLHAITLWEHLQQNLFHARQMEGIARNLREQAAIEWERFRTKKYDMKIMGVVERERAVMRRFDEEGSGYSQPRLVVERPSPPLVMVLPGYQRTPTPLPVAGPSGYGRPQSPYSLEPSSSGTLSNPIIVEESDSDEVPSSYDTAPESRIPTPEEERKQRRRRRVEEAFNRARDREIRAMGRGGRQSR
jgi:hypothetical protein